MCMLCPPLCLEPFMYFIGKSEWIESLFFCMKSKRHGAVWSTYFTAGTAIIHFIICVWLLVSLHRLDDYLEWNEKWNFMPPGIIPLLYIQLLLIILLFCLSFVLMIGINQGFQGKKYIYTWMWGFGAIRWYEVFLGIYILVWLGGHRIPDVVFMFPQSVFIGAYWMINVFIMIWCMLTVSQFFRECNKDMYGKIKRLRYFKMLSNIRNAAISRSQSMFSGAATPRSMLMSRSTLGPGQSQASLSVASYPTKQPRSHLPSTASHAPSQRGYPPPQASAPQGSTSEYPQPQQRPGQGYAPPAMSGLARPPAQPRGQSQSQYPGGPPPRGGSTASQPYFPPAMTQQPPPMAYPGGGGGGHRQ